MKDRIGLYEPTRTADEAGDVVITFARVDTVWGEVIEVGGSEDQRNDQTQARNNSTVKIRSRKDIKPDWMLRVYESKYHDELWLDIVSTGKDRKGYMTLACTQGVMPVFDYWNFE